MRLVDDETWALMTLWQEGRSDRSLNELIGRAEVILNRMRSRYFSDGTVAGTVLHAEQFSGWNAHDPNRIPSAKLDETDPEVGRCLNAWKAALSGTQITQGALLYYDDPAHPSWAANCVETCAIGTTRFLKPKGGT